jgi:hypothetical protein
VLPQARKVVVELEGDDSGPAAKVFQQLAHCRFRLRFVDQRPPAIARSVAGGVHLLRALVQVDAAVGNLAQLDRLHAGIRCSDAAIFQLSEK